MNKLRYMLALSGLCALMVWGTDGNSAQVGGPDLEDATTLPEGIDVQTRGPVHEAFAQPVMRDPEAAPLIGRKLPEPVPELPPELKPEGDYVTWIPGYWAWDGEMEEFLWVSGLWRNVPPDRAWVPGYWYAVEDGWQWVSGYWSVTSEAEVTIVPAPPEPIAEAVPPAPDIESTYIPGCWVHVEQRFYWRPGHWVQYRPGWTWSPACYYWTPAGHVFVDGYWDHDFDHRGMLFAPVRFANVGIYSRSGFYYRPRHTIAADFLLSSLFVRGGGTRLYYFGDYYEPRYARAGFIPWVDVRLGGGRYYDPLFNYYRWRHRDQPRWEAQLRNVYQARREGTLARPPRTYREQVKLAAAGSAKDVLQVAVPLERFKASTTSTIKLRSVTKTEITQVTKHIEEIQTLRQVRSKGEATARAKGGAKGEAVRFALPRPKIEATHAKGEAAPPPPPTLPKAFAKPFEGKVGEPKGKDLDSPKGKDKLEPLPKGTDKLDPLPKGKDKLDPLPKGKDKLDPLPKGKDKLDPLPKGTDKLDPLPKGKDKLDPLPKGKDKLNPLPKGTDKLDALPKGKDKLDPLPKDPEKLDPKGKDKPDPFPKGLDRPDPLPKGTEKLDPFPKGKGKPDLFPKGKEIDSLPKGTEKPDPSPKGKDLPKTPKQVAPPQPPKDVAPPQPIKETDLPKGKGKVDVPKTPKVIVPPTPPVDVPPKAPPPLPIPKATPKGPPRLPEIAPPKTDAPAPVPLNPPIKGKGKGKDRDKGEARAPAPLDGLSPAALFLRDSSPRQHALRMARRDDIS